ncbi:MAG: sodium:proton antiporter [Betaproteobacteria bacterium]|nr:sodium:proton antiporter [Betaproteobacteria bacterium]
MHLPELIVDLGYILAVAACVTLLFKKIGQPVVLGYLLAGILVGPEVDFLPTVKDKNAIKVWAEIGVIVLLFGLGLEFSFRKLASVGKAATVTALTEVIAMLGLGYALGRLFDWNMWDSLFLGGILAISSTTIIIRALDELGMKQKKFASLVFGVLVVEDLVAILLLVLLTAIATTNQFQGIELLSSAARLVFFLTLWFLGGIFLVPWLLRKARESLNPETTLIVSLALCFGMVVLAAKSGFSPALGAFVMGSILAETPQGEKIEHTVQPVRDLFAAVFFVSVGMLFDLSVLAEYWKEVLLISALTVFGKLLSSSVGALISGQNLKTSVFAGLSLAQIGEFSFIIATLGMTLKVTSEFLYPIAVSVSVLTTFTTPYLIRSGYGLTAFLEKRLPAQFVTRINQASMSSLSVEAKGEALKAGLFLFLNSVVVIALALASAQFLRPFLSNQFESQTLAELLALVSSLLLSLPFLWAIVMQNDPGRILAGGREQLSLLVSQSFFALLGRVLLALALIAFMVSVLARGQIAALVALILVAVLGALFFRNFGRLYSRLEEQFLEHLNEKERSRLARQNQTPTLAPWDAHLTEFVVHPNCTLAGQSLGELRLRETVGVSVAMVERGERRIFAPRRDDRLLPADKIHVIGTEEQLALLAKSIQEPPLEDEPSDSARYGLRNILLTEGSLYVGKTIRESQIRENTGGIIVGLERDCARILNPESEVQLQENDRLWIVGDLQLIAAEFARE